MKNRSTFPKAVRGLSIWGIVLGMLGSASFLFGARQGAVATALPPFVPVPAPQKTLQPVSPFNIVGFIQKATLDNPGDVTSGGTLVVNGITIIVPRNTPHRFTNVGDTNVRTLNVYVPPAY